MASENMPKFVMCKIQSRHSLAAVKVTNLSAFWLLRNTPRFVTCKMQSRHSLAAVKVSNLSSEMGDTIEAS